jgi:4-hydroxy-tetrahydrodipicolinate reductase
LIEVARARLAVFGITGRMGQSLIRALREEAGTGFQLSGALASAGSAHLGCDAALDGAAIGVLVTADVNVALRGAQVALDFSVGDALPDHARACAAAGVPLLVGTTGLNAGLREALAPAAQEVAVLMAPNTSLGLAVVARLAAIAAQALGEGFDIEIMEAHHRAKRDAPSGTALALGEAVAEARGQQLGDIAVFERHGPDTRRKAGSIGFAAVRAGDIVGEHTLLFAAAGERVEITHRVSDRAVFARGALEAAAWLIGQPAGLYDMQDMLARDRHGQ